MKKELSEMFALGAIDLTQLIQGCDSFEDLKESLKYAEDYGKVYNRWCHDTQQKEDEKESSWKEFIAQYEDIDLMYKQMDDMWYDFSKYKSTDDQYDSDDDLKWIWRNFDEQTGNKSYSDEELQAAYDLWYNDRKKNIKRIAKEAKSKNVSHSIIFKFMQEYNLTAAERTVFWLAFYEY